MEINGKVIQVLPEQVFDGKNGDKYYKYSFVVETSEQYAKKICLTCMGKDRWEKLGIRVGLSYNLGVDVSSREWNGRWFTEASCWNAVTLDESKVAAQESTQTNVSQSSSNVSSNVSVSTNVQQEEKQDDLPF